MGSALCLTCVSNVDDFRQMKNRDQKIKNSFLIKLFLLNDFTINSHLEPSSRKNNGSLVITCFVVHAIVALQGKTLIINNLQQQQKSNVRVRRSPTCLSQLDAMCRRWSGNAEGRPCRLWSFLPVSKRQSFDCPIQLAPDPRMACRRRMLKFVYLQSICLIEVWGMYRTLLLTMHKNLLNGKLITV